MDPNPFFNLTLALGHSQFPYCIAGGFAVVMHGSSRFTPDINIIVPFEQAAVQDLVERVESCDLSRDESEVSLAHFLDPVIRSELANLPQKKSLWFRDKNQTSFSVSLFTWHPVVFSELMAEKLELRCGDAMIPVSSMAHLQEMKFKASRPQDTLDLENLQLIEQIRRMQEETGASLEEIRLRLKGVIDDDSRLENLMTFMALSPAEKMQWLGEMLTMLSQFM